MLLALLLEVKANTLLLIIGEYATFRGCAPVEKGDPDTAVKFTVQLACTADVCMQSVNRYTKIFLLYCIKSLFSYGQVRTAIVIAFEAPAAQLLVSIKLVML